MNIFMMHVVNFVGMCKFYFMNMAKFRGYEQFLWIWKKFMGMKLWLWKNFIGYVMSNHGKFFCGYDFGSVGIFRCDFGHGKFSVVILIMENFWL